MSYATSDDAIRHIADMIGSDRDDATRLWEHLRNTDMVRWVNTGNLAFDGYQIMPGVDLLAEYAELGPSEPAEPSTPDPVTVSARTT